MLAVENGADFCTELERVRRVKGRGKPMTRYPICNPEAEEIDRDIFEGVGYDCKFHGRFRVSGTVLAQRKRRTRRQWEHALMLAKARL